ncbi:hypothetical protein Tco_0513282 [Tanacetum coccineum]
MTTLQFANTHNLVVFLPKPAESEGFEQIVDFLNAHTIKYALTVNHIIYTSYIEQLWATVKVKTVNGEVQLQALVDGKKIIITEAPARRDLQLNDEELKKKWVKVLYKSYDPHHPLSLFTLQHLNLQKKQKPMKPKRKDTEVPQPSSPIDNVVDEAVYEEMDDVLERAATTATSLDASGLGDSIRPNPRKHLRSKFLLETSSGSAPDEDASKQRRKIDDIDKDAEFTLVDETQRMYGDDLMFDTSDLASEEVFVVEQGVPGSKKDDVVSTAGIATTVSAAATIVLITPEEITLAQALEELKTAKPKVKGIIFKEPVESTIITTLSSQQPSNGQVHDKDADYHNAQTNAAKDQKKLKIEEKVNCSETRVEGSSKRAREELEQESSKKQKLEDDKEIILIKRKKSYYQIIRADGHLKMYLVFSHMLKSFNIKDLETLYKLLKAKYGSTRPAEDLDLVLYGDLKTMFEPHVEDNIWKNQSDYKVLDWKLYDSCGVHSLRKQKMSIISCWEISRYPFTTPTITNMLNRKLKDDHWNEMCYQLLNLLTKQLKNQ